MLFLAIVWIVQGGHRISPSCPSRRRPRRRWPGAASSSPSYTASSSFLGFEAGVPLAEESNNARRSLMIAIMASTIGIGLFYCVLGYATVAGWGFTDPADFRGRLQQRHQPVLSRSAQTALGFFGVILVLFVIANSSFACSIAGQNASTRVYYSLGRAGVFPSWLNHINPEDPDAGPGDLPAGVPVARVRAAGRLSFRAVQRLRVARPAVHDRADDRLRDDQRELLRALLLQVPRRVQRRSGT